jgi:Thymidylate synthase
MSCASQNGTDMEQTTYAAAAGAFRGVLTALQTAPQLEAEGPDATRLRRGFREHLNYSFTLADPLHPHEARDGRVKLQAFRQPMLTTVMMRSNSAFTLLPFNLFEFSLLAEVVAVESRLERGSITYFAGSMHLYDHDSGRTAEFLKTSQSVPPPMGPMPSDVSPLGELTKLGQFEADLRHGSAALNERIVQGWLERADRELNPYWAQFAFVLVTGVAAKIDRRAQELASNRVQSDLKPFLPALAAAAEAAETVSLGTCSGRGRPHLWGCRFTVPLSCKSLRLWPRHVNGRRESHSEQRRSCGRKELWPTGLPHAGRRAH